MAITLLCDNGASFDFRLIPQQLQSSGVTLSLNPATGFHTFHRMLSHIDSNNRPSMVNVGDKPSTKRTAHAVAVVVLPPELAALIEGNEIHSKKGPLFQTASLAGVMATKKTSELIPLCHPLRLDDAQVDITSNAATREVEIHCRVQATDRTGVEMEALMGASIAALTLYDMGKAVSHGIVIKDIRLLEKTGGKSDFKTPQVA